MQLTNIGIDNAPSPDITDIDGLIGNRNESFKIAQEIESLCSRLEEISHCVVVSEVMKTIKTKHAYSDCTEKYRKIIDKHFWFKLLNESKYGAILTTSQYIQHQQQIAKECPTFTRDKVVGTFIGLEDSRLDSMLAAIADIHSSLYPRYANNDNFKFKKKTIITGVFAGGSYSCFSNGKQKVSDFIKYLMIVDGKDITDNGYDKSPAGLLAEARKSGASSYQFEQCEVRMFGNGNIHVLLNDRMDLLDRLNDALANFHGKTLSN